MSFAHASMKITPQLLYAYLTITSHPTLHNNRAQVKLTTHYSNNPIGNKFVNLIYSLIMFRHKFYFTIDMHQYTKQLSARLISIVRTFFLTPLEAH